MSVCLFMCVWCVKVENDRCESPVHHKYLVSAGPGEWRQVSVKLKAGVNTLLWQVYSLRVAMTTSAAVKIRQIEIRGDAAVFSGVISRLVLL